MTKSEILDYLKENQDARGIAHWKDHEEKSGLKSYGIGLTKLQYGLPGPCAAMRLPGASNVRSLPECRTRWIALPSYALGGPRGSAS